MSNLKLSDRLKWGATIISVIGGLCVTQIDPHVRIFAFMIWLISNTLWILYAKLERDYPVMITFIANWIVNLYGLYVILPYL